MAPFLKGISDPSVAIVSLVLPVSFSAVTRSKEYIGEGWPL